MHADFWLVLAASPPKPTRKTSRGGEAAPNPTPEAGFATALIDSLSRNIPDTIE
jgi:hypothetical protein